MKGEEKRGDRKREERKREKGKWTVKETEKQ